MAGPFNLHLGLDSTQPSPKTSPEPDRIQAQAHTFTQADYQAAALAMGRAPIQDMLHLVPHEQLLPAAEKPARTAEQLAAEWKQAYTAYRGGDYHAYDQFNKDLTETMQAGSLFGPEGLVSRINKLLPDGQGIILHNTTHGFDDFQHWTFQNIIQLPPDQAFMSTLNDPEYGPCYALSSAQQASTSPAWMKELTRKFKEEPLRERFPEFYSPGRMTVPYIEPYTEPRPYRLSPSRWYSNPTEVWD